MSLLPPPGSSSLTGKAPVIALQKHRVPNTRLVFFDGAGNKVEFSSDSLMMHFPGKRIWLKELTPGQCSRDCCFLVESQSNI